MGGRDGQVVGARCIVETSRADPAKASASPKGGKPRKSDRLCLTGILFVLKTGIPWEDFPPPCRN
jgi:hypothetical protein